jgi:hypothetical protein
MFDYDFKLTLKSTVLAFAAIFLSNCSPCFADAGTPLMWATTLHLFIGNAFIGLLEGLLIAKYFSIKFWRTALLCVLMVIANYVSSFAGLACIPYLETTLFDSYNWLSHLPTVFWQLVALLFVITVFIEWPFVFFGFPPGKGRLRKSLLASLLAQSCSYGLLIPSYAMLSTTSLITESKFSQSLDFSKNKSAYVYFLRNEDHSLYRARLDGSKPECISKNVPERMNAICTYHSKNGWLICACFDPGRKVGEVEPLLKILNPTATRLDGYLPSNSYGRIPAAIVDLTSPPPPDIDQNLETQSLPTWNIYWAYGGEIPYFSQSGIYISPWKPLRSKKDEYYLALDTPLLQLWCQHVSLLPGDQLVFDIGMLPFCSYKHDIVIYDLHSKKLASVALGHSPIVLLDGATEAFTGKLANDKDIKPY